MGGRGVQTPLEPPMYSTNVNQHRFLTLHDAQWRAHFFVEGSPTEGPKIEAESGVG